MRLLVLFSSILNWDGNALTGQNQVENAAIISGENCARNLERLKISKRSSGFKAIINYILPAFKFFFLGTLAFWARENVQLHIATSCAAFFCNNDAETFFPHANLFFQFPEASNRPLYELNRVYHLRGVLKSEELPKNYDF